MFFPLTFRRRSLLIFSGGLLASWPTLSAGKPESPFPPVVELRGMALLCNGKGTRTRATLRVYDMALYTSQRVKTSEDLLALRGPKALRFEALRTLSGTELGVLLIKGMENNNSPDKMQRHAAATTHLIGIFSARSQLKPHEEFAMEFVPGKGTQFYIGQQAQSEPIGDAEFFEMILRIWFGPASVDPRLRDELLGVDN